MDVDANNAIAAVMIAKEAAIVQDLHTELLEQQGGEGASDRPWTEIDKSKLPASAFLWVEDQKKKATWHLPYKEGTGGIDPETGMFRQPGPVNLNALRAIAAAVGGARTGVRMRIPEQIHGKIKKLLKRFKIGQYAESRQEQRMDLKEFVEQEIFPRFAEAVLDKENCIVRNVAIMRPTSTNCTYQGGKGRRFSVRALESVARLMNTAKCYRNHQGRQEAVDMDKVRKIEDYMGFYENGRLDSSKVVRADLHYLPTLDIKDTVEAIVEQPRHAEQVGMSVHAFGPSVFAEDKHEDIEDVIKLPSADLVTAPGSTVNLFESNAGGDAGGSAEEPEEEIMDYAKLNISELRENRPDLIDALAAEVNDDRTKDDRIKTLDEQLAQAKSQNAEHAKKIDEFELRETVKTREVEIAALIEASELKPEHVSEVFLVSLRAADGDEAVKALLEDRQKMVKESASGVHGMGDETTEDETQNDDEVAKKFEEAAAG